MSAKLVLVTGATGHLGFRVLVEALEAGYRVKAPVRRAEQIPAIKAAPSVQKYLNELEFVVVPDIVASGAYNTALQGVTYVIHVASPLAQQTDNYERDVIEPATNGTIGILKSALKIPSIKRFVFTSSLTAIVPWEFVAAKDSDKVWTGKCKQLPSKKLTNHLDQDTIASPLGPYSHYFEAYSASKALALHATESFIAKNKPSFDVINMMPTFFIGKNELVTDIKDIENGTNALALAPLLGKQNSPLVSTTVYVNDVAKVHVLALDPKILKQGSHENFMISSGGIEGTNFDDAIDIFQKNFPEQAKAGLFPLGGTQPVKKLKVSSERTEKVFGIKLASYETQVNSVVEHYIELTKAT
ncbi:Cercosporin toxin biosynthesis cluster 6 [Hyphodiscus hymeniophilus]|uniref:Cercosporin toxin biosynthesis cluster 6 n=1 Tax=Hyphodiscus hymeniophilus TaxID=353542 RepID=A0A9P7AZL8_9HELO|nr:Cercosporin toxin biosynthesis cluster 6 [Hyphodiscus hymeniophilus]